MSIDLSNIRLCVFDVDGTLGDPPDIDRSRAMTGREYAVIRNTSENWRLFSGRRECIRALQQQGIKITLATNQAGVAYGHFTQTGITNMLTALCADLGISQYFVCYTHPSATVPEYRMDDYDRKPKPGMLFQAMRFYAATCPETLFVGDRDVDKQTARNAGVAFAWADDFFREEEL